ncbi:MAG TPA: hypothetical protein VHZ06_10265 [Marmoricola sp.]|nr:hypothetical protein [Marmoricola sp.]
MSLQTAPSTPPDDTPPLGLHDPDRIQKPIGNDIRRRPWESFGVFAFGAVGFTALGNWMVVTLHVVGFDALERYTRALMVWHNNPPKLAAIGLDQPPLTTVALTPLTIFRDPVSSLAVIPVGSAIFAGLLFVALNTVMRRCGFIAPVRYLLILVLACNPLFAFYASSGRSQMLWASLFVAAASAVVAWYSTADIRFLMTAGLVFSVAALADYDSLIWFGLTALVIATVLSRLGAKNEEIEGSVVGFATPVVYVIAVWAVVNLLVLKNPIAWINPHSTGASLGLRAILEATGQLILAAAPLAIAVLPMLVFRAMTRRDVLSWWLVGAMVIAIVQPGVSAYYGLTDSPMAMGSGVLILVATIVGGIWLVRSSGGSQGLAIALVVALAVSIPWTLSQMKTYKYQSVEGNFAHALTSGHSQEGVLNHSGQVVGYDPELAMADYIKDHVSGSQAILTDNSVTYGVILLTGRPDLFFDRVDRGDGPWLRARNEPPAKVKYLLLTTSPKDLLRKAYPDAARGTDSRLPIAYRNDRYVLVEVPSSFSSTTTGSTSDSSANTADNAGSTP